MPPGTPSPRRFLPGRKQPSPQKNAKATPASGLRHQLPLNVGDAFEHSRPKAKVFKSAPSHQPAETAQGDGFGLSTPKPKPKPQFAPTPRFSHGRSPAQSAPFMRPSSPPKQNLAQALRQPYTEEVQEVYSQENDEDGDEEMLELEPDEEAVPTTETDEIWKASLPHSPKRRRLGDAESAFASPARPIFKHPTAPASHIRAASVIVADDKSTTSRPTFLRSSLAPSSENYQPPPEAFSPHRRGEKFVPGGMAATLQQWVVETGQAAVHSRKGQGYLRGEDYVLKVKVESATARGCGNGPVMVRGRLQDGDQARLLLVLDSKEGGVDLKAGRMLGIRAPTWEIDVDGVGWTVGVDWKVVQ